jgi:uncharacterized protein YbjT (DUF2867 family)
MLEEALVESGMSYAVLRPAVLYGKGDILVNNIAWTLRHLPLFGVFGDGRCRVRPIHVDDLAALAVQEGRSRENVVLNAVGPETFTYRELVATIGRGIGSPRPVVSVPPWLGYAVARVLAALLRDVILTRDEIKGLMADLLYVDTPPTGTTAFSAWVKANADTLGRRYASELTRRRDRMSAYGAHGAMPGGGSDCRKVES